jgi:hypothetical protein
MWHNKIKMDEEKSKHVVLAPQNCFGSAFKYYGCWSLFAIGSVSPICSPNFSFMGGVGNK